MRVILEKYQIEDALSRVRQTVSSSEMVQVLQCFCFKDGKVMTFNGRSGTITNLDLQGMSFAIQADKFWRLITSMPKSITLDLSDSGVLNIKSGKNETKLNTVPAKGFPFALPKDMTQWCFAPDFVEALSRVQFSVSTDATKAGLMGVGVSGDYVYSSDTKRVSRFKLASPVPTPLTIPSDAVSHLVKLGQPEQFLRTNSSLMAWYPATQTTYLCQVLATDFPFEGATKALERLIGTVHAELPADLSEALARVQLMSSADNSDVVIENTGNGLILSSMSEIGDATEVLDWDFPEKFRIAANPALFKQAFENTRKVDLTNIVKGDKRQLLFKADDGFDHLLALMALRE